MPKVYIFLYFVIQDDGGYEEVLNTSNGDVLPLVKRNSAILGSLTQGRAPPPKNRRRPSLKKRHDTSEIFTEEEGSDKVICVQLNMSY